MKEIGHQKAYARITTRARILLTRARRRRYRLKRRRRRHASKIRKKSLYKRVRKYKTKRRFYVIRFLKWRPP
nr:hypothetical protein TDPV-006 [Oriental turtle dovepox virus]WIK87673.1 hypothetical protein TDPV-375 [Oriental turtle dovepox virus]